MRNYKEVLSILDRLYPDALCELEYNRDYELLIATLLSAQCSDKRVNEVTRVLFGKYDIFSLSKANISDLENILHPLGNQRKKSRYVSEVAKRLVSDYGGLVPNDRTYLESLPGVGRKTCNVVLSNIYGVPAIAVDTHVKRVAKRLGLTDNDDVSKIEEDLMKFFPKDKWSKVHHQLVLFGRYTCTSQSPHCDSCPFNCGFKKVFPF